MENKRGYSAVILASTFTQSGIIYGLVSDQIMQNKKIKSQDYKITKEVLENKKRHNSLTKVFSKASSNLGLVNVSAVVGDEIGAMQDRENLNSIQSGLAMAQSKPLQLFASNPRSLNHTGAMNFCGL